MRRQMELLPGMIVLFLSFLPARLDAQRVASLQPGTRVRIQSTSLPEGWRTGYLSSMDSTRVALAKIPGTFTDGRYVDRVRPYSTPLSQVRSLEVSRGRHGRFHAGVIGGLEGALIGTIVVGVPGWVFTRCDHCMFSGIGIIFGPIVGAPVGATWGAIAGARNAPERWETVPLPHR